MLIQYGQPGNPKNAVLECRKANRTSRRLRCDRGREQRRLIAGRGQGVATLAA